MRNIQTKDQTNNLPSVQVYVIQKDGPLIHLILQCYFVKVNNLTMCYFGHWRGGGEVNGRCYYALIQAYVRHLMSVGV